MKLLAQISKELPERYYVGIDIGYREHVAVGIPLSTFVQAGDRWKRTRTIHFASSQSGLERLHKYLGNLSADPQQFIIVCEPTGGYYGATLYHSLLEKHYYALLLDNVTTRHIREKIFGHLPKTDEIDARVMARNRIFT